MDKNQDNKKFLEMKALKQAAIEANKTRHLANSKNRLKAAIEEKFKTAMIGSLARFEKTFGDLWGHFHNKQLNKTEEEFNDKWELARTEILNHCHLQLRAILEDELPQYIISRDGFTKTFQLSGAILKEKKRDY